MNNKIPTLTGSESVRRESVSRERLIDSLITGKRFRLEDLDLDINRHSFKKRMIEFTPFVEITEDKNGVVFYFITNKGYGDLLSWFHGRERDDKPRKQKITKNKLSIADICQNIAEGMRINNVLPRCAR